MLLKQKCFQIVKLSQLYGGCSGKAYACTEKYWNNRKNLLGEDERLAAVALVINKNFRV